MLPLAREARAAKGRTMNQNSDALKFGLGHWGFSYGWLIPVAITAISAKGDVLWLTETMLYGAFIVSVVAALLALAPYREQVRFGIKLATLEVLFISTIVALLAALLLGFWWHAFMALLPFVVTFIICRLRLAR